MYKINLSDRLCELLQVTNPFLLVGDLETGGAIATQEQYNRFLPSLAHFVKDGGIIRYDARIGGVEDIEIIEEIK